MPPNRQPLLKVEDFLLREYDQAWHHVRQNETMRSQYMGFFFATLAALVSVILSLAKDRPADAPMLLLAVASLGSILFFLGVFVLSSITKMGATIAHHTATISSIRSRLSQDFSAEDAALIDGYNTNRSTEPDLREARYSVQRAAEDILHVVLAFIWCLELGSTWQAFQVLWGRGPAVIDSGAAFGIGIGTIGAGIYLAYILREAETEGAAKEPFGIGLIKKIAGRLRTS